MMAVEKDMFMGGGDGSEQRTRPRKDGKRASCVQLVKFCNGSVHWEQFYLRSGTSGAIATNTKHNLHSRNQ
jgi:hypothetical protein